MVDLIKQETATNIGDIMTKPFSTAGNIEQAAINTTLMETMKNYFECRFILACGIPEITLGGTVEDYQSILDQLDELMKIFPDFVWNLKRVHEHLIKVYQSKTGIVDHDWWRTMVIHEAEGSGGDVKFTGWLADFVALFVDIDSVPGYNDDDSDSDSESDGTAGWPKNNSAVTWQEMNFRDVNKPAVILTDFILGDQMRVFKKYYFN